MSQDNENEACLDHEEEGVALLSSEPGALSGSASGVAAIARDIGARKRLFIKCMLVVCGLSTFVRSECVLMQIQMYDICFDLGANFYAIASGCFFLPGIFVQLLQERYDDRMDERFGTHQSMLFRCYASVALSLTAMISLIMGNYTQSALRESPLFNYAMLVLTGCGMSVSFGTFNKFTSMLPSTFQAALFIGSYFSFFILLPTNLAIGDICILDVVPNNSSSSSSVSTAAALVAAAEVDNVAPTLPRWLPAARPSSDAILAVLASASPSTYSSSSFPSVSSSDLELVLGGDSGGGSDIGSVNWTAYVVFYSVAFACCISGVAAFRSITSSRLGRYVIAAKDSRMREQAALSAGPAINGSNNEEEKCLKAEEKIREMSGVLEGGGELFDGVGAGRQPLRLILARIWPFAFTLVVNVLANTLIATLYTQWPVSQFRDLATIQIYIYYAACLVGTVIAGIPRISKVLSAKTMVTAAILRCGFLALSIIYSRNLIEPNDILAGALNFVQQVLGGAILSLCFSKASGCFSNLLDRNYAGGSMNVIWFISLGTALALSLPLS